jgi:hypothetical protein
MSILLEKHFRINRHELRRIYLRMATNLENKHELQRMKNAPNQSPVPEQSSPAPEQKYGAGHGGTRSRTVLRPEPVLNTIQDCPEPNLFWFRANSN